MAKIILNDKEFTFTTYNRNTSFFETGMSSSGSIYNLKSEDATSILEDLAETTITYLAIINNEETIYELENINAKITSIDESYNEIDGIVIINVNLVFN